jgi:hypothetical protein
VKLADAYQPLAAELRNHDRLSELWDMPFRKCEAGENPITLRLPVVRAKSESHPKKERVDGQANLLRGIRRSCLGITLENRSTGQRYAGSHGNISARWFDSLRSTAIYFKTSPGLISWQHAFRLHTMVVDHSTVTKESVTDLFLEPQSQGSDPCMMFCTTGTARIRLYTAICVAARGQNTTWSIFLGSYSQAGIRGSKKSTVNGLRRT